MNVTAAQLAIAGLIFFLIASSLAATWGAPIPEADKQLVVGILLGAAGMRGGEALEGRVRRRKDDGPVVGE